MRNISWSRGYLPHIEGAALDQHIVIRTADSLPAALLACAYDDPSERREALERALDDGFGSRPFAHEAWADLMAEALLRGQGYDLKAWCVMPNHVHALIAPREGVFLGDIVRRWKGPIARAINAARGVSGAFWAREYFDRYVRGAAHYEAVIAYIEANPVAAGLCGDLSAWPWSSASRHPPTAG